MWLVQSSSAYLTRVCYVLQRAGSCLWCLSSWIHLHPVSSVFQPSMCFKVCTGSIGDGMQLYWHGETVAAERHAFTSSWWSWLISADSWNCSNIRSVRLVIFATYVEHFRVTMHRVRLYGVCGSSKATIICGIETHFKQVIYRIRNALTAVRFSCFGIIRPL